ncbi:MAG: hypothetical protein HY716_04680 [Planctomycetes bacterium]|nr:hypothetical protein [Planctomycetota bacterium]
MNRLAAVLAVVSLSLFGYAQDERDKIDTQVMPESFAGKEPPKVEIDQENWINATEAPSPEKYKGQVVWLEFGFLG